MGSGVGAGVGEGNGGMSSEWNPDAQWNDRIGVTVAHGSGFATVAGPQPANAPISAARASARTGPFFRRRPAGA